MTPSASAPPEDSDAITPSSLAVPATCAVESPESDLRTEFVALRLQVQELQAAVASPSAPPIPISGSDAPPAYAAQYEVSDSTNQSSWQSDS
jgi:hypothetical protein